jgi:hypothetical protein
MNIHLVTVVGGHLSVFNHMLRHYRDNGIQSLLLNIQLEEYGGPTYEDVKVVAQRYGARINAVLAASWLTSVNAYLYKHTMDQAPNDWFVLADVDEFQVYPEGVEAVIKSVSERGYEYVQGFVIDRISRDGGFSEVNPSQSLWQQFPLAGMITFPLLHANILKVVAARGCVRITPGQHYALSGNGCPREQYNIGVHHFKWTSGLLDRMRKRVQYFKNIGDDIWRESERLVVHCERNGGKIDISDPRFRLHESGMVCPHEDELDAFVSTNATLMPGHSAKRHFFAAML